MDMQQFSAHVTTLEQSFPGVRLYTHIDMHMYIYIYYIYTCISVCVCVHFNVELYCIYM